jgi:hypothetical protein
MEVSQANRYITPTLQANLNLAISDVIRCLNAKMIFEAWEALQTLYDILPPDVHKEVKIKHDNIKRDFEASGNQCIAYEDLVTSHNEGMTVLNEHTRPFFREMYELLYKGGYLEKQSGPTTKVRGLDRISEALG